MNLEFRIKLTSELSEKFIIDTIKESIKNHELLKTENSRHVLLESCCILLLKDTIKRDGIDKTIKDMNNLENLNNFFKSSN